MKPQATTPPHTVSPKRRATVLLVEDHQSVRDLLQETIRDRLGHRVVVAGDADGALCAAERHHPDLAIVDIGLPGPNGIELVRRLRRVDPSVRILIYSSMQNVQVARGVMQAGRQGFVEKSEPLSVLRQAINAVLAGKIWFSPGFNSLMREALVNPGPDPHLSHLTPREREVLLLVAQSHSSKEVAAKLCISVKTAENHRTNLMRKLGIHDTAALVRFTYRHDLLDPRLG